MCGESSGVGEEVGTWDEAPEEREQESREYKPRTSPQRGSDDDESGRAEEYLRQKPWGVDNDDRMNRLERGLASRHSPIVDMVVKSAKHLQKLKMNPRIQQRIERELQEKDSSSFSPNYGEFSSLQWIYRHERRSGDSNRTQQWTEIRAGNGTGTRGLARLCAEVITSFCRGAHILSTWMVLIPSASINRGNLHDRARLILSPKLSHEL
ncbi:hypothetical protein B0H14DRAFT_2608755 [Mycena olivaceomarginata]|nr:hypothetical protein B0H14DRAFT_2608755 [Mycena olivaceomarginata]